MVRKISPKICAIIQARLGSTRLPGKVMMDLCGKTVLARVIERVKCAKTIDSICVATSINSIDDIVALEAKKNKVLVYRGSEEDVLDRYCKAALTLRSDIIVRVTADNPLTEPSFIDLCVDKIADEGCNFVTMKNVPYGSGVEVICKDALLMVSKIARQALDREHVTSYLYKRIDKFNALFIEPCPGLKRPDIRVTLDTIYDYFLLHKLFCKLRDIKTGKIRLKSAIDFIDSTRKGR